MNAFFAASFTVILCHFVPNETKWESFAGSNVQLVAPDSIQKEIFAKKEAKNSWKCNLCSKCQEIPGICCRECTCINPIELASALKISLYSGANTAWLVCYVLDLQPFFSKDPFSNHSNEKGLFSKPFFQGFSPSFSNAFGPPPPFKILGPCWEALLVSMCSWWPLILLKKKPFAKKETRWKPIGLHLAAFLAKGAFFNPFFQRVFTFQMLWPPLKTLGLCWFRCPAGSP